MPEEQQGENVAGSPAAVDENVAESSHAQQEASTPSVQESATPSQSQPGEEKKPWYQPPEERWKEILRERDEARRAYQDLAARVSQPVAPATPQAPEADPWEGLVNHPDPVTAQGWQQLYKLQRPIMEKVQGLERAVETGTAELAALRVENFRLKNPDILPNSLEEQTIAAYVKAGYPLDVARKAGLFDVHYGKLKQENETLKGRVGTVPQRVVANTSEPSAGMPPTAGLPRPSVDWREKARQAYRKGGDLATIVNAAGARPAA